MSERGVVHILVLLILIAAIVGGVYLAMHPQIFHSRADSEKAWINNLNLIDAYGNPIKCDITKDPPVCYTSSDDISVGWNPNQ